MSKATADRGFAPGSSRLSRRTLRRCDRIRVPARHMFEAGKTHCPFGFEHMVAGQGQRVDALDRLNLEHNEAFPP